MWRLLRQVIHVVDHGDEEVEEELATIFHFVLHRSAALESVSCPDNEREIVCTKLRVVVRGVRVRKPGGAEDGRALNSRLKALLLQCKFLQFFKSIAIGLAVYDGIFEDGSCSRVDNGFASAVTIVFQIPAVTLLVVFQTRRVVTLVKVFENGGKDLGFLVGEIHSLVCGLEVLSTQEVGEERTVRQHILMSSEESLLASDSDCDDSTEKVCQSLSEIFPGNQ
jgi:hypothetical protein